MKDVTQEFFSRVAAIKSSGKTEIEVDMKIKLTGEAAKNYLIARAWYEIFLNESIMKCHEHTMALGADRIQETAFQALTKGIGVIFFKKDGE